MALKPGDRVKFLSSTAPLSDGLHEGMRGEVLRIDDFGTIHVRWDFGEQMNLFPGIDRFRALPQKRERTPEQPHPVQPLITDEDGLIRFKANAIVRFLLNDSPNDTNDLARMSFSREDWVQLMQLIGYTLAGFGELPYVRDEDYERAFNTKEGEKDVVQTG